jgi:hypothetical protein
MNGPLDSFWYEISNHLDRIPVWLPGTPMRLGDVGVFDGRGWSQQTTLAALGIEYSTDLDGEPVTYDYSSADGAEVSIDLSAPAVPAGHLGLQVRFSRGGAFVLKADRVTIQRVPDLAGIDHQILEMYQEGAWKRDWVVVTEVAHGGPSVTLVSAGSQSTAVVDLGAVGGASGAVLPGTKCAVTRASGLAAAFAAPTRTALMWRGRCVHDRRWRKPVMDDRGGDFRGNEPGDGTAAQVADVEYPDDLPHAYYESPR